MWFPTANSDCVCQYRRAKRFRFPLIKFVPWAAYASLRDGRSFLLEQHELSEALRAQPLENLDRLSFDESIKRMADAEEIRLPID